MINEIKKALGLRYNERLWGRPSKFTRELFADKRELEHEAYDEHFTGKGILMMPLSLVLEGRYGEINIPEYHAKKFLEEGKVRSIKVEGEYRLVAPIFYHSDLGAVFGDKFIDEVCKAKNIKVMTVED